MGMTTAKRPRGGCSGSAWRSAAVAAALILWPVAGATQDMAGAYEAPRVLPAALAVPRDLLAGDHYRVDAEVVAHGYANRYTIHSDFGDFEAAGEEMLRTRIHEVAALAALKEIKKTRAFAMGLVEAAQSPFEGAKELVRRPVQTIAGIPKGIYRFVARLGEMAKSKPSRQEQSRAKELIGFASLKRQVAHELSVDVYSTNPVLQDEMDAVTWAGFAGGMSFSFVFALVPLPPVMSAQITSVKYTRRANSILRDNAPADLRRMNRETLTKAGLEARVVEAFLDNPWLSPAHHTRIALAVAALDGVGGRDVMLRLATRVNSEAMALMLQQVAEMTMVYHQRVMPVRTLITIIDSPAFVTAESALVMILPADRLMWTPWLAQRAAAAERYRGGATAVDSREIWVSGNASPRALRELVVRNITVFERARGWLSAKAGEEEDRASP